MYRLVNFISYILGLLVLLGILLMITLQNILNDQKLLDRHIKRLARIVPKLFWIKVNVQKLNIPDKKGSYIFMANHVNIFDGFILYGYISHFIRGLELEDHFRWPIWGSAVKRLGNIPISHKNPAEALKSLDVAAEALAGGTSLIVLPEGHRTRDGRLQTFGKGGFRLAKQSDVPIIPIAMRGAWEIKRVQSPFVKPGTMDLVFGEVISSERIKELSVNELKEEVFQRISDLLDTPLD